MNNIKDKRAAYTGEQVAIRVFPASFFFKVQAPWERALGSLQHAAGAGKAFSSLSGEAGGP